MDNQMTNPDTARRDALYRQAGEALHLSQSLELFTSTLIALVNGQFDTDLEMEGLVLPDSRDTLGRLLAKIRSTVDIDGNGEAMLRDALRARNAVAHDFFNRNVQAFSDVAAHGAAMEFLREETRRIAMGAALTSGWCSALCDTWEIDRANILVRQSALRVGGGNLDA